MKLINITARIIAAAAAAVFFTLTVSAVEVMPDGFTDNIPEEIAPLLPDGIMSGDASAEDVAVMTGADYIFGRLGEMLKNALAPTAGFFSVILSALLISSAVGVLSRDISGGKMSGAVSMITCLALAVYIISAEERLVADITAFTKTVSTFTTAMVPMMAGLLSASANTTGAAVTSSGLLLFSAAVQYVSAYIFVPIFRLGLSFAVISSVAGAETGIGGICELIKKTFTWLAAGAATIFSTVLSYQTALASSADTAAARSIKYTVGSAIPVVGGALSDAVRTATAGLSVIKNGAGAVGIVVLLLLTCPLLISLAYTMAALGIASFAAKLLGCGREAALLSELRAMMSFAVAIVALAGFVFIFALALFIRTAPAISS